MIPARLHQSVLAFQPLPCTLESDTDLQKIPSFRYNELNYKTMYDVQRRNFKVPKNSSEQIFSAYLGKDADVLGEKRTRQE